MNIGIFRFLDKHNSINYHTILKSGISLDLESIEYFEIISDSINPIHLFIYISPYKQVQLF